MDEGLRLYYEIFPNERKKDELLAEKAKPKDKLTKFRKKVKDHKRKNTLRKSQ